MLQWKTDAYGRPDAALYIGGLYVGRVFAVKAFGPWRAWIMTDDEGDRVGKDLWPSEEAAKVALFDAATKLLPRTEV